MILQLLLNDTADIYIQNIHVYQFLYQTKKLKFAFSAKIRFQVDIWHIILVSASLGTAFSHNFFSRCYEHQRNKNDHHHHKRINGQQNYKVEKGQKNIID